MSEINAVTVDTDKISDADFDYLTDAALELVFDTLDLTEADEKTVSLRNFSSAS